MPSHSVQKQAVRVKLLIAFAHVEILHRMPPELAELFVGRPLLVHFFHHLEPQEHRAEPNGHNCDPAGHEANNPGNSHSYGITGSTMCDGFAAEQ